MATLTDVASGPYLAACGLLLVTGGVKVRAPRPTATAMHAIGLPANDGVARAVGVGELAIGTTAALAGGAAAYAVLVAYLAFLAVAARLRMRAPATGCGCIGDQSATVGVAHLLTCGAAAAVAAVYAAGNGDGLASVLRAQPFAGVPFAFLVACCTGLVTLFMSNATEARPWQPS